MARSRRSLALAPAPLFDIDSPAPIELDGALQLLRLLWVTVDALHTASARMNRQLRITGPQRLVIRVLGLAPGVSAAGLARILQLHPSTVNGLLKQLEAHRLISRWPPLGDGRRALLRLTADGQRLNAAIVGTVEAATRKALRYVTARDQATVRAVLEGLADQLGAAPATRSPAMRRVRRRTA